MSQPTGPGLSPTPQRLAWIDTLRALAAMAVVVLHVAAGYVEGTPRPGEWDWEFANFTNASMRWCVNAFLVISGAAVLPQAMRVTPGEFYRKRLPRLLIPLLFWTVFYVAWNAWESGRFDVRQALVGILRGNPYFHLWFLYMLPGLYLAAPVIAVVLRGVSSAFLWRCVLGAFLLLIPHAALCVIWNIPGTVFLAWTVFVPWFVVGWLVRSGELPATFTTAIGRVGLLLTSLGSALAIAIGASVLAARGKPYAFNLMYGYFNPFVVVMSICVVALVRASVRDHQGAGSAVKFFAAVSFGIYLVHPFVMSLLAMAGLSTRELPVFIGLPSVAIGTIALSALLTWLLQRVPQFRALVG